MAHTQSFVDSSPSPETGVFWFQCTQRFKAALASVQILRVSYTGGAQSRSLSLSQVAFALGHVQAVQMKYVGSEVWSECKMFSTKFFVSYNYYKLLHRSLQSVPSQNT